MQMYTFRVKLHWQCLTLLLKRAKILLSFPSLLHAANPLSPTPPALDMREAKDQLIADRPRDKRVFLLDARVVDDGAGVIRVHGRGDEFHLYADTTPN